MSHRPTPSGLIRSRKIILEQLEERIVMDGAHDPFPALYIMPEIAVLPYALYWNSPEPAVSFDYGIGPSDAKVLIVTELPDGSAIITDAVSSGTKSITMYEPRPDLPAAFSHLTKLGEPSAFEPVYNTPVFYSPAWSPATPTWFASPFSHTSAFLDTRADDSAQLLSTIITTLGRVDVYETTEGRGLPMRTIFRSVEPQDTRGPAGEIVEFLVDDDPLTEIQNRIAAKAVMLDFTKLSGTHIHLGPPLTENMTVQTTDGLYSRSLTYAPNSTDSNIL